MTASFKAIGKSTNGVTAELWWADRRSPDRTPGYRCELTSAAGKRESMESRDLTSVDEWAKARGIIGWKIVRTNRCLPGAAILPVEFPEAPDQNTLADLLARLKARRESLADIARSIDVHPAKLIAWLRGFAPGDDAVPGRRRQSK